MKTIDEYNEQLEMLITERAELVKQRKELSKYINKYSVQISHIKSALHYRDSTKYKYKHENSVLYQMFGDVRVRDLTPEQKREYEWFLKQERKTR